MKKLKMIIVFILLSITAFSSVGSSNIKKQENFTIEEMLTYSMEDELLARSEYEKIIIELNAGRPFTNIVEAEKKHIEYLEPLLIKYNIDYPEIVKEPVVPRTLPGAYKLGVEAEIANIAMYDRFLEEDIPSDIKETFIRLRDASKNHLRAFERQVARQN